MTEERFQRITSTTAHHFCFVFEKTYWDLFFFLFFFANLAWKLSVIIEECPDLGTGHFFFSFSVL